MVEVGGELGGLKPGKKRAVLGRDVAVPEFHLVQLDLRSGTFMLCRLKRALYGS